jgi:hypothetical protein
MTRRFSAAFLLGILLGLGGEALLLSQRASSRASTTLKKDFHVLFFIHANTEQKSIEDLKEKLAAISGSASVHFVSQKESLSFLKTQDPGLLRVLSFFPNNPMDPAFEVSLNSAGLRSFPTWINAAQATADWTDTRYPEGEIKSILRFELYARFLGVALAALLCVAAVIGVLGVFIPLIALSKHKKGRISSLLELSAKTWAMTCLGAAFGAAFSGFFALPLAHASPWWAWPSVISQCLLLISAALAGGSLCAW